MIDNKREQLAGPHGVHLTIGDTLFLTPETIEQSNNAPSVDTLIEQQMTGLTDPGSQDNRLFAVVSPDHESLNYRIIMNS